MTARSSTAVPPFSHLGLAPVAIAPRKQSIATYARWAVQVALALLFLFAGGIKFVLSTDGLTKNTALSAAFLRFIGVCEALGAIGLVMPGVLRLGRFLTPLAATGLAIIMIGATTVTVTESSVAGALFPLLVGLLCAFVVYRRRTWLSTSLRQSGRGLQ
jgi:DoxX-like family